MTTGLLLIDLQRDYFPGGAFPLVGSEDAVQVAARVLHAQRTAGAPVIHVRHVWDASDATFMRPGTDGIETHEAVAPLEAEQVVSKSFPNSFHETGLHESLQSQSIDALVVVGMMSSMCVDATVRAAADLGYPVTIVHDGCAAPDLAFGGHSVPGAQVHAAIMAALGSMVATVVSAEDLLGTAS